MRVLASLSHNSTWGPVVVVHLPHNAPTATARDKLVTKKEEEDEDKGEEERGDEDVLSIDSCQSRDEVDGWTLSKGKE